MATPKWRAKRGKTKKVRPGNEFASRKSATPGAPNRNKKLPVGGHTSAVTTPKTKIISASGSAKGRPGTPGPSPVAIAHASDRARFKRGDSMGAVTSPPETASTANPPWRGKATTSSTLGNPARRQKAAKATVSSGTPLYRRKG